MPRKFKINFHLLALLLLISTIFVTHFFYFEVSESPINFDDSDYNVAAVDYYRSMDGERSLWSVLKEQKYCPFPNIVLSLVFYFIAKNWLIYKMVNLLYYLIMIYAVYFIARKMGDKNTGLLAAFIVSTMPFAVSMLRLNFPYYQLTAMVLLTLVFFIRSKNFLYRKHSVFFALSLSLSLLIHHLASLYFIVIILGMVICAKFCGILSFSKVDRRRIGNFLIALCIISPFVFFVSRAAASNYTREMFDMLSNIIKCLFSREPFYKLYGFNAIRYAAVQSSYLYTFLMIIFTRPVISYLSYWLFAILFIFGIIFLFRSMGFGLDTSGLNFFIVFPLMAILFSNSFLLFFKKRKNKISKIIFFIILIAIIINGALYIFPNNIDNGMLNKNFLPQRNMFLTSKNENKTSVFLKNAMSILFPYSNDRVKKGEILVSCNRWHSEMGALIFYSFLEHDLYISAVAEESPTQENYIYIKSLAKEEKDSDIAEPIVNGYRFVKKIRYSDDVFYFFSKGLQD